eukprot:6570445-Prymnesium_polylepis.2
MDATEKCVERRKQPRSAPSFPANSRCGAALGTPPSGHLNAVAFIAFSALGAVWAPHAVTNASEIPEVAGRGTTPRVSASYKRCACGPASARSFPSTGRRSCVDLLEAPEVYNNQEPTHDAADPRPRKVQGVEGLSPSTTLSASWTLDPESKYNHKLGHEVTTIFLPLVSMAKDKISDLAEDAQSNAIVTMHTRKDAPECGVEQHAQGQRTRALERSDARVHGSSA